MARLARVEVFGYDEVTIVHVLKRRVRRFFLLGNDLVSGKNFDNRKKWMESELVHLAKFFFAMPFCQITFIWFFGLA